MAAQLRPTACSPLNSAAQLCRGGRATTFAYGQTGSGKTFTMSPLPLRTAADIFSITSQAPYNGLALHVRYGQEDMVRGGVRECRRLPWATMDHHLCPCMPNPQLLRDLRRKGV